MEVPQQLPFLESICWQTQDVRKFSFEQMLHRYERGWYYRGVLADLSEEEFEFLQQLIDRYGSWLAAYV